MNLRDNGPLMRLDLREQVKKRDDTTARTSSLSGTRRRGDVLHGKAPGMGNAEAAAALPRSPIMQSVAKRPLEF